MAANNSNPSYRHGHASRSGRSKTYCVWRAMMQRCYRQKEKAYKSYGARGITVCKRWHDFANFLADMGEAPASLSLDRIDNNGNYEPENCRWASKKEQLRNTRITSMLTHNGKTMAVGDWADQVGLKPKTLKKRIADGWDIADALATPKLSIHEVSRRGAIAHWGKVRP